ncbi:MAG: glycosyltransferase family 4 protein [Cyclobacteriaceae bacterium]
MRILILNYEYPPLGGGAANATYHLLKQFREYKNLHIDLVTSSTSNFKVDQIADNVTIHYLNIGKSGNLHYQSIFKLLIYSAKALIYSREIIKSNDIQLIHAFFGIPCGFISLLLGKPYIVSLRGSDVPFYNKRFYLLDSLLFSWLSRIIWKKSAKVIANSNDLASLARENAPYQSVSIIENGVDTKLFHPSAEPKNQLKILSVGRLIERKGFKYLVEAIKTYPDISLTIVGDGPQSDKLKKLAPINVTFLGNVPHGKMPEIYRNHNLFILPSLNEGMSNTVLEAMASGLALILTDTGGNTSLIDDCGLIIEKKSSKAIIAAINEFVSDEKMVEEYGKVTRQKVKKLSWKSVATSYYKVYKSIISQ